MFPVVPTIVATRSNPLLPVWKCSMAQHRIVRFVDDLDGSEASGRVTFALDGRSYEIDLSEENAGRLHDAEASFDHAVSVCAGRTVGRVGSNHDLRIIERTRILHSGRRPATTVAAPATPVA